MMNKIAIAILVLFSLTTNAQVLKTDNVDEWGGGASFQLTNKFEVKDTANVKVIYQLKAKDRHGKEYFDDIQILLIGKNLSKTYSNYTYLADSTATAWIRKGSQEIPSGSGKKTMPIEVFKDYKLKKITINCRNMMKEVYQYIEPYPINFNWQLDIEKKKILGYTCQKAKCSFRGRNYVAWFTSEIPISEGPYKFSGLPGLILQIHDETSQYDFTCIGIENTLGKETIKLWKWNYKSISREKYLKFEKSIYHDPIFYLNQAGVKVFNAANKEIKNASISYNPIEIE
ncbi:hypothetical protein BFS16_07440 [Hoylesella timonensis]|uniref:GLPGLI family protein n=1 Tax=Hoylesella timonensis TaxID=386414 RepID=A0A2K0XJI6_9BACT|nr:GLPGLI family protein [Hoylesella timonensis]PNP94704.1 hypothetical protein BFS16_07440 [Hoylesella timonensis]